MLERGLLGIPTACLTAFLGVFCLLSPFPSVAMAEIYVRIHKDGAKEFTNRPSGLGWVYYMSEDGSKPVVEFAEHGNPRNINDIIKEISDKFKIDDNLVKAIIAVESNFDPDAVSGRGAQGLMQLMPSTSRQLKVLRPLNPRENIIGGVRYIKGLLASYGDLKLALAAYNAGPGAVKKYSGIPPYSETINYVEKVIRFFLKFKSEKTVGLPER
jgi:soluble lytic murein transglycosylase-like protein